MYVLEHMFFHSPLLAACESGAGKNEITFAQVHIFVSLGMITSPKDGAVRYIIFLRVLGLDMYRVAAWYALLSCSRKERTVAYVWR
jgi:hypothetical protein